MRKYFGKGMLSALLSASMILGAVAGSQTALADSVASNPYQLVMTLGADLSPEDRSYVLSYFGKYGDDSTETITITNQDEHDQLGGLIDDEIIGTHTYSCALVRPTTRGGIQVKTANMNYVTSNMIASTLSTSGVANCEVLTVAPFVVSGTGALTGVMMAYEHASGESLDEAKKSLANEEIIVTGELSDSVGQDQATLVVNDIKIHIVRDQVKEEEEVKEVVDDVIDTTQTAVMNAASAGADVQVVAISDGDREKLYDFGSKYSQMDYRYSDLQRTLERVVHNIVTSTGIEDPIEDTFETIDDEEGLSADSILLGTDDEVLGENADINATDTVALGDHPAEPVETFSGEVTLTEAGTIKADHFVDETNLVVYRDLNGSYALMDLNGNMVTDAVYTDDFYERKGMLRSILDDGTGMRGVLSANGDVIVPFTYQVVEIINDRWAAGMVLEDAAEEDYDYYDFVNNGNGTEKVYYKISQADLYYAGSEKAEPVAELTRTQCQNQNCQFLNDYINLADESGVVTTYDGTFTPLRTADSLDDFGEYDEDTTAADNISAATGWVVWSFRGNYAKISADGKCGLIDRYGNQIIPVDFEEIGINYRNDLYLTKGYASVSIDGNFAYVTEGGTVTGSFDYPFDDVENDGICALYEKENGGFVLLSGDGVASDLGTTYTSLNVITESGGMLWTGEKSDGYDLIDWHGNIVLADSGNVTVSANGNYLIAQNGYTSSSLYLINDASPVSLAETAGGATELETRLEEGASLDIYTGGPELTRIGTCDGEEFMIGSNLIAITQGDGIVIADLKGNLVSDTVYGRFYSYDADGWLIVTNPAGEKYGVISPEGEEVIPCEYDYIDVLSEQWIAGYSLVKAESEEEYDIWVKEACLIDQAEIYYVNLPDVTSATFTREQVGELYAEEDYLNLMDRETQNVTTYDHTFTPVASADSVYSFPDLLEKEALFDKLQDQTGLYISDSAFKDGYIRASSYDGENHYGIIDMSGNEIIPTIYDNVYHYGNQNKYLAGGYFCVCLDDQYGYVTAGGEVSCELQYDTSSDNSYFLNYGYAGVYVTEEEEGSRYLLVSADGVETDLGSASPQALGSGMLWRYYDDSNTTHLIDWHGSELASDFLSLSVSGDDQYLILRQDSSSQPELYMINAGEASGIGEDPSDADVKDTDVQAEPDSKATSDSAETELGTADASAETETEEDISAEELLEEVLTLLEEDEKIDQDSLSRMLQQAADMLEKEGSEAAGLVKSAQSLLPLEDYGSISTLLQSARSMLG